MPESTQFVCSGCRWWLFHPREGAEPGSDQSVGYCRRFPPSRRENGVGAWPITFGNDWCGEFTDTSDVTRRISRGVTQAH
jgi:hypothetical protein